jgi:hypothetical protein
LLCVPSERRGGDFLGEGCAPKGVIPAQAGTQYTDPKVPSVHRAMTEQRPHVAFGDRPLMSCGTASAVPLW